MNLNGLWEFKSGNDGDAVPVGETLPGKILVPFPVESAHSPALWNITTGFGIAISFLFLINGTGNELFYTLAPLIGNLKYS